MTEQPEALRLAELLDGAVYELPADSRGWSDDATGDHLPNNCIRDAAAELRRLHQSEREGWRYADELEQERKLLLEQNTMLDKKLAELERVNAQLLEALETCGEDEWYTDDDFGMVQTYDEEKVRAAIRAMGQK